MTYVVAILTDDTFEDPIVILGVSEQQIAMSISLYLTAAKPMTPAGPLVMPDPPPTVTMDWLQETLEDVESIDLVVFSTANDTLKGAGDFVLWVAENVEAIGRQHA